MKVEIKLLKTPIEIIITEEIDDKSSKEFLVEMFEFLKEHKDFLSDIIHKERILDTERSITSSASISETKKKDVPEDLIKLSKATNIDVSDLGLILNYDEIIHGVYPLIPISLEGPRTKRQQPAILVYLYQNYIINKKRTFTSYQLNDLLEAAVIDPKELSKSLNNYPFVTVKSKTYSITAKGISDGASAFQDLINKVK